MREILFRGKVKNGFKWIYGYLSQTTIVGKDTYNALIVTKPSEKLFEHDWEEVIPETVGQYTGLTDKNGTKIFEGDIVKSEFLLGVVKYATAQEGFDSMCGFMVDDIYDGLQDYNGFWHQVEVIGNIYDNPELVKGE